MKVNIGYLLNNRCRIPTQKFCDRSEESSNILKSFSSFYISTSSKQNHNICQSTNLHFCKTQSLTKSITSIFMQPSVVRQKFTIGPRDQLFLTSNNNHMLTASFTQIYKLLFQTIMKPSHNTKYHIS